MRCRSASGSFSSSARTRAAPHKRRRGVGRQGQGARPMCAEACATVIQADGFTHSLLMCTGRPVQAGVLTQDGDLQRRRWHAARHMSSLAWAPPHAAWSTKLRFLHNMGHKGASRAVHPVEHIPCAKPTQLRQHHSLHCPILIHPPTCAMPPFSDTSAPPLLLCCSVLLAAGSATASWGRCPRRAACSGLGGYWSLYRTPACCCCCCCAAADGGCAATPATAPRAGAPLPSGLASAEAPPASSG